MNHRPHLLIGQAPSRSAQPGQRAWDSASGRRLAGMMGISLEKLLHLFDTTNLNPELLGTVGKYDMFDMEVARNRAAILKLDIASKDYDIVLCAGKRVAELMGAPLLQVAANTGVGRRLCGIPHPGGTNRWWNDKNNRAAGIAYLSRLGRTLGDVRTVP